MMKEMQKYTQGKIPPDKLPFDLTAELGEIKEAVLMSPGVYYLSSEKEGRYLEVYVVTADAPAVSEKARSYGQEPSGHPDLRVYDLSQPGSGRYVIDFELCRYRMKHHLPGMKGEDSLYDAAIYGAEEHPDYFGNFPVPFFTPRGCTVRHRTIMNGVYWLETDRCEEMLAVCYPIWHSELSASEQDLGEQLEHDEVRGINNTMGYLFFPKQGSTIALYELSLFHPEIAGGGIVDLPALKNTIYRNYPEYAAASNQEQSRFQRGTNISYTPDAGTEFIRF